VTDSYEVFPLSADIVTEHAYLGTLADSPVTYEFVTSASTTFTTQLTQRYQSGGQPILFSLMVVRQNGNNGGVTEVSRINPAIEDWVTRKDSVLGMSLWQSTKVSKEVGPGSYLVEVSTSDNQGRYRLMIGDEDNVQLGYFNTLGQTRTTQKFFGLSSVRMLMSSYVYYPLGICLLLAGFLKFRRYRKLSPYGD
jgi:hypothetical protein